MSWNYPASQTTGIVTPPELEDLVRSKTHPVALFCHLAFRSATILSYLLCKFFTDSFIVSFVVVTFLLCLDFWTVKNVSGRLLAGLRWWNQVDDEGQSQWVFESKKGPAARDVISSESRIFWGSLFVVQFIWAIFMLWSFFSFNLKWFLLVIVAFVMSGANLYGYIRCVVGSKTASVTDFLKPKLMSTLFRAAASTAAASATSDASSQQQQRPGSSMTGSIGSKPVAI